jgi:hypothetical protein
VTGGFVQDVFAILIVAIAAAILVRRAWQRLVRRQGGACGSCSNCASTDALKSKPLVSITPLRETKPR